MQRCTNAYQATATSAATKGYRRGCPSSTPLAATVWDRKDDVPQDCTSCLLPCQALYRCSSADKCYPRMLRCAVPLVYFARQVSVRVSIVEALLLLVETHLKCTVSAHLLPTKRVKSPRTAVPHMPTLPSPLPKLAARCQGLCSCVIVFQHITFLSLFSPRAAGSLDSRQLHACRSFRACQLSTCNR
jgi:hypothetical protein